MPPRRGRDLIAGLTLLPAKRLEAFTPEQLEMVVEHWLHEAVVSTYARVLAYGGPGDKGRDIVALVSDTAVDPWDNYQCKQYARKLRPADLWPELGKLVYWTMRGSYTIPRRYVFVAPLGTTAKTLDLLADPEQIRAALRKEWTKHCATLCGYEEIAAHLDNFAFPAFEVLSAGAIVDGLKDSAIYPVLFGSGLQKPRPPVPAPPQKIAAAELPYVTALIDAYDDHCSAPVSDADAAFAHERYGSHLRGSRREFYCAESLREFSKDVLVAPDDYTSLQQQIADGIRHTVARDHPSGFDRVLAACEQATSVQVDDHPLAGELAPSDRAGMCHQLANDGRVKWRR